MAKFFKDIFVQKFASTMVLILDGNSDNGLHVWKKSRICEFSRPNQMPLTNEKTEIAPDVRTYLWATIQYKYHGKHLRTGLVSIYLEQF